MPISYELFPGSTSEFETLEEMFKKFTRKYKIKRIRVIADRGLFSNKNLSSLEGLSSEGIGVEYIVSCPLKKLPQSLKDGILNKNNYKDESGSDNKEPGSGSYYETEYNGRRVIVNYSEVRGRHDVNSYFILTKIGAFFLHSFDHVLELLRSFDQLHLKCDSRIILT